MALAVKLNSSVSQGPPLLPRQRAVLFYIPPVSRLRPTLFSSNLRLPAVTLRLPFRLPPKKYRQRKEQTRTKEIFTKDKGKNRSRAGQARPSLPQPPPPRSPGAPLSPHAQRSSKSPGPHRSLSSPSMFLTGGALGCFHLQASPIFFHSLLLWGAQDLHIATRWCRNSRLPQLHRLHTFNSGLLILSWR